MDLQDVGTRARFLIRDRDGQYPDLFDPILADAGSEVVLSRVRMPRMNSIMDRWVQTCRNELLDRTLIWNQAHLLHKHVRSNATATITDRTVLCQAAPLRPRPEPITKPITNRPRSSTRHATTRPPRRNPAQVRTRSLTCTDEQPTPTGSRVFIQFVGPPGHRERVHRELPGRRHEQSSSGVEYPCGSRLERTGGLMEMSGAQQQLHHLPGHGPARNQDHHSRPLVAAACTAGCGQRPEYPLTDGRGCRENLLSSPAVAIRDRIVRETLHTATIPRAVTGGHRLLDLARQDHGPLHRRCL
jgi:hypothetical protein